MKKVSFLIITLFLFKAADCQLKSIPTKRIEKLWLKELFCIDSLGIKTKFCQLDLMAFNVKFSKAYYDKATKQLRLIGRLALPIPEVGAYLSETDTIAVKRALAYTTYDPSDINKDGYFDISMIVKPKQSLFFYHPAFFSRQFELYKLLNEEPHK